MAEVVFSEAERCRIADIEAALRATAEEFFVDARDRLSPQQWNLLLEYATARVRRALELACSLHAISDAQERSYPGLPGRGRGAFVRAALAAWADCYAAIEEPWRTAAFFERIEGGERRFLAEMETLESVAIARLFEVIDSQYEQLLARET